MDKQWPLLSIYKKFTMITSDHNAIVSSQFNPMAQAYLTSAGPESDGFRP